MAAMEEVGGAAAIAVSAVNTIREVGHAIHCEIRDLEAAHPDVDFGRLKGHAERLVSTRPGVLLTAPETPAEPAPA